MTTHAHGPWVDVHSHPGRCFLGGLASTSPFVALMGQEDAAARTRSSALGEVAVVAQATVADLGVIGLTPTGGLGALREFGPGEATADHHRQMDFMATLLDGEGVQAVLSSADVEAVADTEVAGVFVSCEGGDFLDGRLEGVDAAYDDGVRSVTLVHYRVNELGDIQTEASVHGGLTGFGREVIAEMNRLGMIVDLAHATLAATVDALEVTTAPIMISHSHLAARGASHPRLLSAEHALAVSSAGGVIGAWPAGFAQTTLGDYCDEICRLVDLVGIDHVAVGTDLDANYRPVLTSYDQFPQVASGLDALGMTASEIDQILGGNFIRLFAAVEECATG